MYDNKYKNNARAMLFGALPAQQYRSILTLPGVDGLCVKHMLSNQVISPNSNQVWIERDTEKIADIVALRDRIFDGKPIVDERIQIINVDVERYQPSTTFDLVNLDLMSTITPSIGLWIEQFLTNSLRDHAVALITLTEWSRGSPFFNWFRSIFAERYQPEAEFFRRHFLHYHPEPQENEIALALLVSFAFSGYRYDHMAMVRYEGSGERIGMVSFRLDNIKMAGPSVWPRFSEVYSTYEQEVPQIDRERVDLEPIPDDRARFNRYLARDHMVLCHEDGVENLYYFRRKATRIGGFDNLSAAMREMSFR